MPARGPNPEKPDHPQAKEEDYPAWPHELQFAMEVGHGEDPSPPWADGHWEKQLSQGSTSSGPLDSTSGSSEGISSLSTDPGDELESEEEEWESDWWDITAEALSAYAAYEANGVLPLRAIVPETLEWWAGCLRGTVNITAYGRGRG